LPKGVETQRQLAFLRQNGCDTFQGYLFSKPLPAEQFADLLREDRRLPDAWLQPACSQEIC
jgi:FOG: EAL domain